MTKVLKISEDMDTIRVDGVSCIRCGRCVKVCPSQIFVQEKAGGPVALSKPENCIVCGHCVAACPTGSVAHAEFPPAKVHPVDYAAMPTPAQVELLMAARRSNRALSQRPVPQEMLDRIVAAADLAPTATNARQLGYTLVTDPVLLRRMSEYTLGVFGKLADRLSHPLVRPWLSRLLPDVYRYVPVFRKMRREYAGGNDRILRGATAVLLIHAPKESRFGAEDANLAYQNASDGRSARGKPDIYGLRADRRAAGQEKGALQDAGTRRPPYLCRHGARDAAVPLPELYRPHAFPFGAEIGVRGFPELCPGYFSCFFRVFLRFASSVRSTRLSPGYKEKWPLLCRGRFSFAARCQLPERPHSPGE